MSRVVAGIPTNLRSTSGRIADALASEVDEVIVVSQGAVVNARNSRVNVLEYPPNLGVGRARNIILDHCLTTNADFCVMSDDDLQFKPFVVHEILRLLEENYSLGIVGSIARTNRFWSKNSYSSKEYQLYGCPAQLFVLRMSAIREVGNMVLPEVMEDIELGLKLWDAGWAVARIDKENCEHNTNVPTFGKGDSQGGIPESRKRSQIPVAVEYLLLRYSHLLRFLRAGKGKRMHLIQYNWPVLCQKATDRWGYIGYEDSRGRKI